MSQQESTIEATDEVTNIETNQDEATNIEMDMATEVNTEEGQVALVDEVATDEVVIDKEAEAEEAATEEVKTGFAAMDLLPQVKSAIAERGYKTPSPIQAEMIPHLLEGRDVIGQAQTGTGKTAAFALPILSRIDISRSHPQVLVLAPTRELANQVAESFEQYASNLRGFRVAAIYGGASYDTQLRQLKRGAHVIVGTPGRTIDHIKRGTLDVAQVDCLVLDEADEMLNMGFLEDVQWVLSRTREDRQIALFSATMPDAIRRIARDYLRDPVEIRIKSDTSTVKAIRQRFLMTAGHQKTDALVRILQSEETDGVIVFAKTRNATVSVAESLMKHGLSVTALNGDMPQNQRERTVERLRSGHLDVLVATDVAARGLDIERISHVINYDTPHDSEAYVHRIGRTGRAGRSGQAILFVNRNERGKLRMIERATGQQIEMMNLPTVASVNALRVEAFKQKISDTIAAQEDSFFRNTIEAYIQETGHPAELVAAALAEMAREKDPLILKETIRQQRESRAGGNRGRDDRGGSRGNESSGRGPRSASRPDSGPEQGMVRYRMSVGHKHGVRPGNIVGAIANEGRIDSSNIGRINIHDTHSTVDLPEGVSQASIVKLRSAWVSGNQLEITRDGESRSHSRSGQQSTDRAPKSAYKKPKYDKPKAEKPAYDKPKFDKPKAEKPAYDKPKYDKPAYDKPKFDKPKYDKPKAEKPAYDKPRVEKPKFDKPKFEKPKKSNSDQVGESRKASKPKSVNAHAGTVTLPAKKNAVAKKKKSKAAGASVATKSATKIKPTRGTKDGQPKRRFKKLRKLK